MNLNLVAANRLISVLVWCVVGALFVAFGHAQEQTESARAEVRFVKGSVTSITNGAPARPLKAGDSIPSGAVVKTGPSSTADLFLGPSAGTLRLTEKSTLHFEKLRTTETGADTAVEVQLHLPEGEMYFNVNKLSKASRYEIKLPTGVAGIRGTKGCFSFRSRGAQKPPVVLLEGILIFVHVPSGGTTTSYEMTAPPGVYFSPTEGVKPAPPGLVQEVERELQESGRDKKSEAPKSETPDNERTRVQGQETFLSPGSGSSSRRQ